MLRIRPYKDSDTSIILSWCNDEATHERWTAGVLGPYPLTEAQFQKTGELIRFTALDEKEVVGFFTLRNPQPTLDELRFGFVIVDPAKRGRGIGREMLRLGQRYAFDIYRAERVSLAVFADNAPALACYRAAGFIETGTQERYTLHGVEKIAVELALSREQIKEKR